jgi:hypothetical protein
MTMSDNDWENRALDAEAEVFLMSDRIAELEAAVREISREYDMQVSIIMPSVERARRVLGDER